MAHRRERRKEAFAEREGARFESKSDDERGINNDLKDHQIEKAFATVKATHPADKYLLRPTVTSQQITRGFTSVTPQLLLDKFKKAPTVADMSNKLLQKNELKVENILSTGNSAFFKDGKVNHPQDFIVGDEVEEQIPIQTVVS